MARGPHSLTYTKRGTHARTSAGRHVSRHGEAGMTLIEMLGYVAVLAVLVNIVAGALLMCSRLSAKGTTALDRVWSVEEIRSEFTEAVRNASAVCEGVGDYRTGPSQVVLLNPTVLDEPDVRTYTVLGLIGRESRMCKLRIREENGALTAEGLDTYRLPVETLEFSLDATEPDKARLVSLAVDIKDDRPQGGEAVIHRFSAAPRGISPRRTEGAS